MKKCSFCGAPLVFVPGEEVPNVVKEDEIQEKLATMKVPRIRNPFLIGAGGMVALVGLLVAVVLYLVIMFIVFTPSDIEPSYEGGAWHYRMDDREQYVFAEITRVVEDKDLKKTTYWDNDEDRGFYAQTAYELNGDGTDNRVKAHHDGDVNQEPDVWVYSKKDLGEKGDRVLIKVVSKPNEPGEQRAVVEGFAPWGGRGFISGWIFLLPGILLIMVGAVLSAIGLIGRADRSVERLFQEDQELRRQQLMLKEAARKQMQEKQKQAQWSDYSTQRQAAMEQTVAVQNAEPLPSMDMIAPLAQTPPSPAPPVYQPPSAPVQAQYIPPPQVPAQQPSETATVQAQPQQTQ